MICQINITTRFSQSVSFYNAEDKCDKYILIRAKFEYISVPNAEYLFVRHQRFFFR